MFSISGIERAQFAAGRKDFPLPLIHMARSAGSRWRYLLAGVAPILAIVVCAVSADHLTWQVVMAFAVTGVSMPFLQRLLRPSHRAWMIILISYFVVVAPLFRIKVGGPIYFADIGLAICCLSLISQRSNHDDRDLELSSSYPDRLIVAYLIGIVPSAIISTSRFGLSPTLFVYGRCFLSVASYFVVRCFVPPSKVSVVICAIAFFAIITALSGIVQVYASDFWMQRLARVFDPIPLEAGRTTFLWFGSESDVYGRPKAYGGQLERAVSGHQTPTTFGGLLSIVLPLVVHQAGKKRRWWLGVSILCSALVLTWTRHAWVAVIVGFGLTWALTTCRKRSDVWALPIMIVGLVLLVVTSVRGMASMDVTTSTATVDRLRSILYPQKDTSFMNRYTKHFWLIDALKQDPTLLLTGTGHTYLYRTNRYFAIGEENILHLWSGYVSDSIALNLHDYGILSFFLLLLIWKRILNLHWRNLNGQAPLCSTAANALGISLTIALVDCLSDNYMHSFIGMATLEWMLVGLFVNVSLSPGAKQRGECAIGDSDR